jgi:hypothetical protein
LSHGHFARKLFGNTYPAGEINNLREREEEYAADYCNDSHQANVPAVSTREARAYSGKLPPIEWSL